MSNDTIELTPEQKKQLITAWRQLDNPTIMKTIGREEGFRFQLSVIQYCERWYKSPKFVFAESNSEKKIDALRKAAKRTIDEWVKAS